MARSNSFDIRGAARIFSAYDSRPGIPMAARRIDMFGKFTRPSHDCDVTSVANVGNRIKVALLKRSEPQRYAAT
jgi:hypothetical protein